MALARASHSATLLPSGKVLVAGGETANGFLASVEVYDPGTGTWAATGSLASARTGHTATLLPSGKVLVAGGVDNDFGPARAEVYDPGTGTWAPTGSLASPRTSATATLLPSGKVLVVGGSDGGGTLLASAEVYDPGTGTWTPTGSLASARRNHTATLLPSGKVLVAGGSGSSSNLASAEVYDPGTGTWAASAGSMTSARFGHTATLLPSGKVLVTGGVATSTGLASAELYDPGTGTWAATGSMASARLRPMATLLPSGKVLVAGGNGSGSAEVYDPGTGTWAPMGALASVRSGSSATLLPSGSVLITGGYNSSFVPLASAEVYEPGIGTWAATGSMVAARYDRAATLLPSGKVLVVGGTTGLGGITSAEVYDPGTGTWAPTASLSFPRRNHTATLLPSGKVLVAGGNVNRSAEVYDPGTGTWASTGSMASARTGHTATLLPSGKVLVTGGWTGTSSLTAAEVYDPAAGTWASTGSMASARYDHTATLLPSGRVLVTGGSSSSAEVYDPATGTWVATGSMATARYNHTATLLPLGKVLVTGGLGSSSAEVYDPTTGTWAATGSMASVRYNHTVTLLPSGRVLAAGGVDGSSAIASAEVYDPATGTWVSTSSMASARYIHTATLLPSGKVLVAGGYNGSSGIASAELYESTGALDAWRPMVQPLAISRPGATVTVTGSGFRGVSEASSGDIRNSATNFPLLGLTAVEGDAVTRVPLRDFSNTSVTATVPAVPDGYYLLTVTVNAITGGQLLLVDGTPPPVPVVLAPASGAVVNTTTPVLSGMAETVSMVTISFDGMEAGTAVADASGSWSFTPSTALAQGPHAVTVQASDEAGNTTSSSPLSFTVDTVAPPAPVLTAPGALVNSATPTIAGMAEPGSIVSVSIDGRSAETATASMEGAWSFTPNATLEEGSHTITATATDAAGNTGPASSPGTFAVDTIAPSTPVVSSPTGGAVIDTKTLTITGTADVGTTVKVLLNGEEIGTETATSTGTWSFTPAEALPLGTHMLAAQSTDAAGNSSPASTAASITLATRGHYGGCASAPTLPVGWVTVLLGIGWLRRRELKQHARLLLCFLCLFHGEASGRTPAAKTPYPGRRNPAFKDAAQSYDSLRFERALKAVQKARAAPGNSPQELLWLDLMEGVLQYELENEGAAAEAFKRALARSREAQIPVPDPSPKLLAFFESVRKRTEAPQSAPVPPPAPVQGGTSVPPAIEKPPERLVATQPQPPVLDAQRELDQPPSDLGFMIGLRSEAELLKRGVTPGLTVELSGSSDARLPDVRLGAAVTALFRPMGVRAEGRLYPYDLGSSGKWRVRPYMGLGATYVLASRGGGGRGSLGAALQFGQFQLFADAAYERFFTSDDTYRYEPHAVLISLGAGWSPFSQR